MDKVHIFSNGSEYGAWKSHNCYQCQKSIEVTDPDGNQWPTCEIEAALMEAYVGDGRIEAAIRMRMNFDLQGSRVRCGEFEAKQ